MAKVTTKYGVNGVLYDSLSKLSDAVGFRVNRKNIEAGNLEGIYIVEVDEEGNVTNFVAGNPGKAAEEVAPTATVEGGVTEVTDEPDTEDADDTEDDTDEDEGIEDITDEDDTPTNTDDSDDDDDSIEYPEKGHYKNDDKGHKAIKKFIKGLSNEQVFEWAQLEGLTWKRCSDEPIDRMRAVMAIKAFHGFGKAPSEGGKKSKSKYADYSLEQLVEMAAKAKIPVKDSKGNAQIQRMYTIMALKEAGLLA